MEPQDNGGSLRDLDGFPITHSSRLWSGKVGCLVSITVTCTFLKSNRFLLVGVFVFYRIGVACLTQRLTQHPLQLTRLTIHLNLLPPAHKSLLHYSAPHPPSKQSGDSPPPSHVSPVAGGPCDCSLHGFCVTGKWKYHQVREPCASSRHHPRWWHPKWHCALPYVDYLI